MRRPRCSDTVFDTNGKERLTVCSWDTNDQTFAGLKLLGEVDFVAWAALHELDIWCFC